MFRKNKQWAAKARACRTRKANRTIIFFGATFPVEGDVSMRGWWSGSFARNAQAIHAALHWKFNQIEAFNRFVAERA